MLSWEVSIRRHIFHRPFLTFTLSSLTMAPRVILRLRLLWTSSLCTDVGTVPVVRPYPVNLPVPLKGSISDFRSY
ncbi:hypothetical protein EDB19DRAFT_1769858, partial [Suillus lakei]